MKDMLNPCPNCGSENISLAGDDFDADVCCNECSLCTYPCYGTANAITVWNNQTNVKKWSFLREQTLLSYYI